MLERGADRAIEISDDMRYVVGAEYNASQLRCPKEVPLPL